VGGLPGANLGVAPHSLRAATIEQVRAVEAMANGGPVHIHVAEQTREVDECIAAFGARPVEFLLAGAPVDARWCLIHATHMTESEAVAMAQGGAVAGLCPITEANLGDGIFPAPAFIAAGGRYGIGSDSNILVSIPEELRHLEYSQRLGLRARNVVANPGGSTGRALFDHALAGGGAALGVRAGIAVGNPADMISLETRAVPYLSSDSLIDAWTFGMGVAIDCVWAMGRKQVSSGRHVGRQAINRRFVATMTRLLSA
jgi:formiminoglutamate deiminase